MWIMVLQKMLLEFVLDMVSFPLWWYTGGARRVFLGCVDRIRDINSTLGPGLWLKNIFVPMFGQYDLQGRLMSFFMRLVNVIGRTIALAVSSAVVISFFFVWLIFPVCLVYLLVTSFLS